jgi:hypothetical protein
VTVVDDKWVAVVVPRLWLLMTHSTAPMLDKFQRLELRERDPVAAS